MRKVLHLYCLWALPALAQAQYHQPVLPDLTGTDLLNEIVLQYKPIVILDYNNARDTLYGKIDNRNDSVTCVYTGYKLYVPPGVDPSTHLYMNGSGNGINAEHTYPQSKGADEGNAESDMHHIFPTRAAVNSARNNDPFGEIVDVDADKWFHLDQVQTTIPTQEIETFSESINATIFEPREDHKGDVARAVMYFYTMYKAEADAADPNFFWDQIDGLCDWHLLDPVSEKEWTRSNYIAQYQEGKANPFVLDCTVAWRTYCSNTAQCETTPVAILKDWGVELLPNTPNPFAQHTVLAYNLYRPMQVRLSVHDALGREIAVLANAPQTAGEHSLLWQTTDLAAGIYVYRLQLTEGSQSVVLTGKAIKN